MAFTSGEASEVVAALLRDIARVAVDAMILQRGAPKPSRRMLILDALTHPMTLDDIHEAVPDVSRSVLHAYLRRMVHERVIRRVGRARYDV